MLVFMRQDIWYTHWLWHSTIDKIFYYNAAKVKLLLAFFHCSYEVSLGFYLILLNPLLSTAVILIQYLMEFCIFNRSTCRLETLPCCYEWQVVSREHSAWKKRDLTETPLHSQSPLIPISQSCLVFRRRPAGYYVRLMHFCC